MAAPARAFNDSLVHLPHDEMSALVKETAARRAAVNRQAGHVVIEGADGAFYVVVREAGNAFKHPGDITVECFVNIADRAWDGQQTPVTQGHVDLDKDCRLMEQWTDWTETGAHLWGVTKGVDGKYYVSENQSLKRTCDADICDADAAAAFKPFFDACASARF